MTNLVLSDIPVQDLNEIRIILSKWSIRKYSKVGIVIRNAINKKENSQRFKLAFRLLTSDIILAVKQKLTWIYNHPKLKNEALSGACIAYFGLLLYRFLIDFPRRDDLIFDKNLDTNLILLYLGADFLLDDTEVSDDVKKELIKCVDNELWNSLDSRVQSILDILLELIKDEPLSKGGIMEAWESEKNAEKQKKKHTSEIHNPELFEELWKISGEKGYKTVLMANKIINSGNDLPNSKIIGYVTQHVDDLVDHESDKKGGINTAATILMRDGKCLDRYLFRCLKEISSMVEIPILGIIYIQIVCNCGYNNPYTSEELKNLLGNFLIFDKYRKFENFISDLSSDL